MNGANRNNFLTAAGISAVNGAVKKAELSTAAEIKVLVVGRSSNLSCLRNIPVAKLHDLIIKKVFERANREFFLLGLNHTRDHTGILIMISLEERRVEVRAGEAIDQRVAKNTWGNIMATIINSIQMGNPKEGICQAVEKVGNILTEHFPRKADDTNEIADEIIFKR